MNTTLKILAATALSLCLASPLAAQEEVPRVALYTDWSVFNPTDPLECFIASAPTSTEARKNGEIRNDVKRGDIRLYIASRPNDNTTNEIAFTGGYPFRDGSTVSMKIGNETFELFTEGEFSWPASPEEDQKIIASMRRGAKAVVTGVSSRGTTTIDTFSLIGFTDALKDATERCNKPPS